MGPGVAHPDQENQKPYVTAMIKVKTDLSRLTNEEFIAKVDLIVARCRSVRTEKSGATKGRSPWSR